MIVLLDTRFERTLDQLVERLSREPAGTWAEAWVFEDEAARRGAEQRLAGRGVKARFRSAYKPLLHFFLEDLWLADIAAATVRYPVHPGAPEGRFRLEAYPLAALLPEGGCRLIPEASGGLSYRVATIRRSGGREEHEVFAPNRTCVDHLGETVLRPCGWLRLGTGEGGDRRITADEAVTTDFEAVFDHAVDAVSAHPWGREMPYFGRLLARVEMPGADRRLAFCDETMSLREAMHEDLYFSFLEVFQRHAGQPVGSRDIRPGQIVPDVRRSGGAWSVRVETLDTRAEAVAETAPEPLAAASRPLPPSRIAAELDLLGGEAFEARSSLGQAIRGRHFGGTEPGVLISGGQHANETSGVVGALRAAVALREQGRGNFAVIPLENPDGYDLHRWFRQENPHHMHHAARYTALGDDLEYRKGDALYETAGRIEGVRRTRARLHVNLHGYPAHEWTRPLTGYVPRGFELWTLPKGHFLILRHQPGFAAQARALADFVARRLAGDAALMDMTGRQLAAYEAHAGKPPFEILHGIPCDISERADQLVPITLITEFPDETVEGEAFRLAHTTQMRSALAAVEALDSILQGS